VKEPTMAENVQPVRLAGSALSRSCHVCAFFHSKEEEYRVLMPFIKDGFERGDRAFHVVDAKHRSAHLERLAQEGIDVDDAQGKGQLEVRRWDEAYIKDAHFDQYRMIETIRDALNPAKKPPGKLTRLVANMEWALEDLPGVHDIVEYETRLNHVLPAYHDPVVCTYDLSRFDAGVVIDIMRTHPMVIVGGILQENPFYVPPDEMLKELEQRAADKLTE
jgi:MEDS: MEthanogen/methylotroph, DcmR Sensory domain